MKSPFICFCILFFFQQYNSAQPIATFERAFGTAYDDYGYSLHRDINFNYFVAGETWGYSAGDNSDIYLVKFDSTGRFLWAENYGDSSNEKGMCLLQHSSGDYFILGNYSDSGNADVHLMLCRIDQNGNLLWSIKYNSGINKTRKADKMVFLPNGNIAIAGTTIERFSASLDYKGFIEILDISGNILQTKEYFLGQETNFSDLIVSSDGRINVCGDAFYNTEKNLFLLKADLNGDTIWCRKYSFNEAIHSECLIQLPDNKIVISGQQDVYHPKSFYRCTDSTGSIVYYHRLSGGYYDITYNLAVSPSNFNLYSAQTYSNFITNMSCQIIDTTGTVSPHNFFFYTNTSQYLFTSTSRDIDYFEVQGNLPCVTLAGSTNIGGYGGSDIAIVHTYASMQTPSEFNKPIISRDSFNLLCPGDSVLVRLDSNYFPIRHWLDLYNLNNYLPNTSDSIWLNEQLRFICMVGMDADSNLWISNVVGANYLDTVHPEITLIGNSIFCSPDNTPPKLKITNFNNQNRYQWFKDGLPMTGDTSIQIFADSSGEYFCRRITPCGYFDSNHYSINSNSPPYSIPVSGGIYAPWCSAMGEGNEIREVLGNSYQWYFQNTILANDTFAASHTYPYPGSYMCIESNSCGSDTILTNSFQIYPESINAIGYWCMSGDSILLRSQYYSVYPTQWYLNGILIPGATSTTLYTSQPGNYSFDYSLGSCFNIRSQSLTVQFTSVPLPITITLNTQSTSFCPGTTKNISITGAVGIRSYWFKDGVAFTNTTSSYVNVTEGGDYNCYILNSCDTTYSDTIHLTVLPQQDVHLGSDTILCNNMSFPICAEAGFDSYQWTPAIPFFQSSCILVIPPQQGGVLTYRITVVDSNNCVSRDTIVVNFDNCLAVNEPYLFDLDIVPFPNPFNSVLNFTGDLTKVELIKVYSGVGKVVWTGPVNNYANADLSLLSSGIYIIEFSGKNFIQRLRVIKVE